MHSVQLYMAGGTDFTYRYLYSRARFEEAGRATARQVRTTGQKTVGQCRLNRPRPKKDKILRCGLEISCLERQTADNIDAFIE